VALAAGRSVAAADLASRDVLSDQRALAWSFSCVAGHTCLTISTNRPPTNAGKSVWTLPPQMGEMLIWSRFSTIACALLSQGLVIGKHPQNALIRPIVHRSRLDWQRTDCSPSDLSAQFLNSTRRAIPPVTHGRLVGDAGAFATTERPDGLVDIPSIENARRAATLAT
jgi:hypothetical protein